MANLITNIAVLGRVQLVPGVLPIKFQNPEVECLVSHSFPNKMKDVARGIEIDTTDCTVFVVTHLGQGGLDITHTSVMQEVFERSIAAISEVTIWSKAHDVIGKISAFTRQVGTLDVKVFFALSPDNRLVGWLNPAFTSPRRGEAIMAGLFSKIIVSNGPSLNPVPPISRRIMSSLDLINLGFYTESFVNLFSLVDDLSQEVVKAGMNQKGLSEEDQKGLLRAIKEERLKVFLCNLVKLCGWHSLEEADAELYEKVLKVNTLRNKIMHGSRRLSRAESIDASNVLLSLIGWLRTNPFGFAILKFPLLQVAQPTFSIIPLKDEQNTTQSDDKPDDKS